MSHENASLGVGFVGSTGSTETKTETKTETVKLKQIKAGLRLEEKLSFRLI